MERMEGYGKELLHTKPVQEGDVILLHSVSGRNSVAIDMAMEAKEVGMTVISITNLNYSKQVTSRHSSGKRLFECSDVVIDNRGVIGDSSIKVEGFDQKIGPSSTVTGAFIIHSIVLSVVDLMLEKGMTPPIFKSANLDGGDQYNQAILTKYKERIHYM
jgi:uncharacterized phosphosugar-binding protein